jgi:hypothetical protein
MDGIGEHAGRKAGKWHRVAMALALAACSGCAQGDRTQSAMKEKPPEAGTSADVPPPRASAPDQVLAPAGRKSLSLDFHGKGAARSTVVYGRFSRDIALSSSDYEVANFLYPDEKAQDIQAGDHGVVILPLRRVENLSRW